MEKISYPIDETLSDVKNKKCPIPYAMKILGSKYKLQILWYLHEKNSTRYNELKRRIPEITNIMLTKSLRELEADGLAIIMADGKNFIKNNLIFGCQSNNSRKFFSNG